MEVNRLLVRSVGQDPQFETQAFRSRAKMMHSIIEASATRRCLALVGLGRRSWWRPDARSVRLIETLRRSAPLHSLCRPVAVARRATIVSVNGARTAGAFGLVDATYCLHDGDALCSFLKEVSTRVPRHLDHSRGSFTVCSSGDIAEDDVASEFDDAFRALFSIDPGNHDRAVIRYWADEIPERVLIERIGSDPDSGWSESAIARRIEKLREAAPVTYRDSTGNLAKVRLANDLLAGVADEDGALDLRLIPDVDRCIELMGDDELMRNAYLDDEARFALTTFVNRRIIDFSKQGGRPSARERAARLENEVDAAFHNSLGIRFANEESFRAAFARALFAIADTQLDTRLNESAATSMVAS